MANEFEITVLRELGDIKALCATNQAEHKANAQRIESLEKTNTRQWWMHALSPLVVGAAAAARKYGII